LFFRQGSLVSLQVFSGNRSGKEIQNTRKSIGYWNWIMTNISEKIRNHYAVSFLVIALLCASVQIIWFRTAVPETILAWILLVNVGFQGILAGFMHWYGPTAEATAKKIGWLPGNPFQKEVAAADAAIGVLGILSFFIRDNFLVATVIGASVMFFFMGIGHVLDTRKTRNVSIYNAGSVVYFDLLLPVAMIILLVLWKTGS
jgi:hypothetical protein